MPHFAIRTSTFRQKAIPAWLEDRVLLALRIGMLGCFVGHGVWGFLLKPGWYPFFDLFSIPRTWTYMLMPLIGAMDIVIGIIAFIRPNRALLIWALFWTLFTAWLRPMAGMGISEFFERAGNFGLPLALLIILQHTRTSRSPFETIRSGDLNDESLIRKLELTLRVCLFMLLAGHAGLILFNENAAIGKTFGMLGMPYGSRGLFFTGVFELILSIIVLALPRLPHLMLVVILFKLACEILHPIAGHPRDVLETIERMGDYTIPLALCLIYRYALPHKLRIPSE